MMRSDRVFTQTFRQLARHALGHASRIDEHQRGAMRLDQPHQLVVDLLPHFSGHHRFQWRIRHFQQQIARPLVPGIDDRDLGCGRTIRCRAHQQVRDRIDRVLRRRQSDPRQIAAAQRCQAFERQGQMCAALVRCDGVDFIHDDRARGRQHGTAGRRTEQDVKRLRRGDEDVRRPAAHAFSFTGWSIAGVYPGPDIDIWQSAFAQRLPDAGERCLQVALDVVGQRLQWRHVDHLRLVGEPAFEALADQTIDRRQERSECLAGPGRRGDQSVSASLDCRPGLGLCRGRRCKAVGEPRCDRGMKQGFWVHGLGTAIR